MAKSRKFDLTSTRILAVVIEDVEVKVHVDANGWPFAATSAFWHTDDRERLHRLVMAYARTQAERAAEARRGTARTTKAAETKRNEAAAHFSRKWLAAALEDNPALGAERLALEARKLLWKQPDHPNYPDREKITEYRAKQYLRAIRNSGDT